MSKPVFQQDDSDGRRKVGRAPVMFEAQLRLAGLNKVKLNVVEISPRGFRAHNPARLHVGDSVYLHVPTLNALHASVRWIEDGMIGCEFAHPLYEPVAEHVVRQYPDQCRATH